MVEPIMYLAIGFLVSMLFGLMIMPLVHNRAVRLTIKRLEAATPISMAEIQADKDQLRAEFAMSARRLEMSIEQLKHKTASQLAEIGKKTDAINRMKLELEEKTAAIVSLEAREQALRGQLKAIEDEFASKTEILRTAEAALAEKQSELARMTNELSDRTMMADSRQIELVAVRAQIEALKDRVADAEQGLAATQQRLASRSEPDIAPRDLADARSRVESLSARLGNLDTHPDQSDENARPRDVHATAQDGALTSIAVDRLRADKSALEEQLRTAQEARDRLQRDLDALQQQAESSWASERAENAVLRERINEIAAEVAKLALTLEGPNATIETLLASAPAQAAADPGDADGVPAMPATLADRIRALQSHATRARPIN